MRRYIVILASLLLSLTHHSLSAQNTFGIMGGYGSNSNAIYPAVDGRTVYGLSNVGVSWRTYSADPFVGCFGMELQYIQRGFSYSPSSSLATTEDDEKYYYTRRINSLNIPVIWQPHFYIAERRIRVFFEAAVTFSYDLNSTYDNDFQRQLDITLGRFDEETIYEGEYEYMLARDNRFGYGLFGGGGAALIFGRVELFGRIRYYWGLSDVVRNRNKYYSNNNDGYENPFSLTPIRSSLNGIFFNFGFNYRVGKADGFASWKVNRVKVKMGSEFNYTGEVVDTKKSNKSNSRGGGEGGGRDRNRN